MKTHTNLETRVDSESYKPGFFAKAKKAAINGGLTAGLLASYVLTGCAGTVDARPTVPSPTKPAATATYTATPAPTYTPTPEPTPVPLEGRLFFDMNGSGLMDEASFNYDSARLTDERQPLQADLLAAINAYVAEHPDIKDGDLVILEEPGLSGYSVCAKSNCVTTDAEGKFQLVEPDVDRFLNITLKDPNAGTPALEMRYVNKWKREVTVPAYTKDVDASTMGQLKAVPACDADANALVCKLDGDTLQVRDQYLNDTSIFKLSDGATIQPSSPNEIGLMQGFLTLPYKVEDAEKISKTYGYDHDPRNGVTQDYSGLPIPHIDWDSHPGWDFGCYIGMPILATFNGNVEQVTVPNGPLNIILTSSLNIDGSPVKTVYGHLNSYLVNARNLAKQGQVVGLCGISGASWSHLHYDFLYGKQNPIEPDDYLTYQSQKDPYGVLGDVPTNFPSEKYSSWTVFNLPIFH